MLKKNLLDSPIPAKLGGCADMLYGLREERLKTQRIVALYEEKEKEVKKYIIDNLGKDDATGVSGKVANVRVITRDEPTVKDWELFYGYLFKAKDTSLLNKALNKAHIKEIWETGKVVPGVEPFNVVTVSLTKV